jgi:hypothetical protein
MEWPSRQLFVTSGMLLLTSALVLALAAGSRRHVIDAAFWFDPVVYDASEQMADRLGGAITEDEMRTIESVASSELTAAFAGLRIKFSDRRDAKYRVRVVQQIQHPLFARYGSSGESRSIAGIGGQGIVNFRMLANRAIAYAPDDADRATIISAIGRGIGRAAVHEFAHQVLGGVPIHATKDIQSYEYRSADRREQYYGKMHWDIAWPILQQRWNDPMSETAPVARSLRRAPG